MRGFAEGQEIGRTDRRGDLLVPHLLPYHGNRLAISDRDVRKACDPQGRCDAAGRCDAHLPDLVCPG